MALYATDTDDLIFAADADPRGSYWCLECFGPVKVRKGKDRFPHFYHLKATPQCRLYSKSEDHMRVQVELQKLFPPNEICLEKPFPNLCRVADALWEREKIVFEIQCSQIQPSEAAARIRDYRTAGYETVWLLDDRIFNRRILRPSEDIVRCHSAYYLEIRRSCAFSAYDQFEIFSGLKRIKKGKHLKIDLSRPRMLRTTLPNALPEQILKRASGSPRYFQGDRLHRAVQSPKSLSLQNWKALEIHLAAEHAPPNPFIEWLKRYVLEPYMRFLEMLHEKLNG